MDGTHTANLIQLRRDHEGRYTSQRESNVHVNVDTAQLPLDFVQIGLVKSRRAI